MKKFTKLKSIPAHIPLMNIDTDMIIPKQFLKTIKRTGLGKSLFYEMRYDESGKLIDKFILNNDPYSKSKILIAGKNFGCGSSREHAPWALLDFGIHCIISNSFADIFFNNSIKNGLLLITLDKKKIDMLMKYATNKEEFIVNLIDENIIVKNSSIKFKVDPVIKNRLVNGYDDIEITLKNKKQITDYENDKKKFHIWKKIINDN